MKEDEGEEGTPSAGEVMGLGEKDPIGDTGQAAYRLYTGQAAYRLYTGQAAYRL